MPRPLPGPAQRHLQGLSGAPGAAPARRQEGQQGLGGSARPGSPQGAAAAALASPSRRLLGRDIGTAAQGTRGSVEPPHPAPPHHAAQLTCVT